MDEKHSVSLISPQSPSNIAPSTLLSMSEDSGNPSPSTTTSTSTTLATIPLLPIIPSPLTGTILKTIFTDSSRTSSLTDSIESLKSKLPPQIYYQILNSTQCASQIRSAQVHKRQATGYYGQTLPQTTGEKSLLGETSAPLRETLPFPLQHRTQSLSQSNLDGNKSQPRNKVTNQSAPLLTSVSTSHSSSTATQENGNPLNMLTSLLFPKNPQTK